ncbi:DUF4762 family protein [Pluralibacter gergoviae]|uniref:DUF4762 family protein n=1 Tax=Pluralibacter gergoviae TaxID=61647 RepID=A0A089PI97_PLUGE|nr:DUF4762 family protein [Pluralibacter gergoviae]AIQ99512.1 hypothetical protein LG71_06155 [Pluralibacter gergoviae]AVR02419.1 DUF4762 domain-containing protein [Pluralibacter gergoviae]EKT9640570.1 DUF4762 family protein [Pluralibacter gergoviae]EKV0915973.1 DUF4762 family protein [Pluralibacter gergoviae]EKV0931668.1 DUF4762 family protein [Pluralibacter gergoviae]
MKKINTIEAMKVIGGCEDVCTSEFVKGSRYGDTLVCTEVVTCTDKHGVQTKTIKPATMDQCSGG